MDERASKRRRRKKLMLCRFWDRFRFRLKCHFIVLLPVSYYPVKIQFVCFEHIISIAISTHKRSVGNDTEAATAATISTTKSTYSIQTNPSESSINILKYCRIHFISFHFFFVQVFFYCISQFSVLFSQFFFPHTLCWHPFTLISSIYASTLYYALYFFSGIIILILFGYAFIFHNNYSLPPLLFFKPQHLLCPPY